MPVDIGFNTERRIILLWLPLEIGMNAPEYLGLKHKPRRARHVTLSLFGMAHESSGPREEARLTVLEKGRGS